MTKAVMKLFAILSIFVLFTHAQEEAQPEAAPEPEEIPVNVGQARVEVRETNDLLADIREPHKDVIVTHKILGNRNGSSFCPGDIVRLLVGVENNGTRPLFVTDVCAAMTPPYDFNQFIRNYTALHLNFSVQQGEQHTIEYPFLVDPRSESLEFGLVAAVYYSDSKGNLYTSIAANTTFPVSDLPNKIDARTFFVILTAIGTVVTAGILLRKTIAGFVKRITSKRGGKSKRSDSSKKTSEFQGSEWLKGTESEAWLKDYDKKKKKRQISNSPSSTEQVPSNKKRGRSELGLPSVGEKID